MYEIDVQTREWLGERYWREDEALIAAREAFAERGPLIEVPSDTGATLATLVRLAGARRIIEVGTLFGYSATWMARALPSDGHLDTLELEDVHADAAEALFERVGLTDRVTVHRGPASDTLATLDGPWDLAFIDADKGGYVEYARQLIPKMRPGGTIIADNVAAASKIGKPDVESDHVNALRAYHEFLANEPRLQSNVLPIGDGLAVSIVVA
ncbi:MAG: putative O-methyltransferase [Thermoleophilia bacterium]|nr:putative O-methyltransferase [Thermoleophilia bacterium]MCZ4496550.1 putative O-methyltransferase [Thermoleophilia bacterium]